MMRRTTLALAVTLGLAINPTGVSSPDRTGPTPDPIIRTAEVADVLEVVDDFWTYLGYDPDHIATDPRQPWLTGPCPWGPLIERNFADVGMGTYMAGVAYGESRCQPDAANPESSARGLAQLMMSIHAHRYYAVGCTPAQWAVPACNVAAARDLYDDAGTSPWRL